MSLTLTDDKERALEVRYDGRLLFRYAYADAIERSEVPKPYFHPLNTLAGRAVTAVRPHDHPWHRGLAMTMAVLSDQNFWGGNSYVHGKGYVPLDNQGLIRHEKFARQDCDGQALGFEESLTWITCKEERWLEERRRVAVADVNPKAGYWALDFSTELKNVSDRELRFGSPTTKGRELAGYGSLFWRGPREFRGGKILAAGGLSGPEVMGRPAPWLAFVGRHDETLDYSTVVLVDTPSNPRYPNKWFVRTEAFACASCSFMFDEEYPLAPGATLKLDYRVLLCNGAWDAERIAAVAEKR